MHGLAELLNAAQAQKDARESELAALRAQRDELRRALEATVDAIGAAAPTCAQIVTDVGLRFGDSQAMEFGARVKRRLETARDQASAALEKARES